MSLPGKKKVTVSTEIHLPSTLLDAYRLYKKDKWFFKSKIYPFIKTSLKYGRPLDQAMILLVGQSGAGKSTTINTLFEDATLCSTNAYRSETKKVSIIRKCLKITSTEPPVIGYFSLVDTPGTFDGDGDDRLNIARLQAFRQQNDAIGVDARKFNLQLMKRALEGVGFECNSRVYPNIVLFFLPSKGTRIEGSSTVFWKSLNALKEANLVDCIHPNLIIVVTHAASMGKTKEQFSKVAEEMKTIIQSTVKDIFGIKNSKVVFIENERHDQTEGFYKLPDGELSHHNLFKAIQECCDSGNDDGFQDRIGKLFVGWYADPKCPDKLSAADVFHPSYEATESMEVDLNMSNAVAASADQIRKLTFQFAYLGRGFCPKSGEIKTRSFLNPNGFQNLRIGQTALQFANGIQVIHDRQTVVSTVNLNHEVDSSTDFEVSANFTLPISWLKKFNLGFDKSMVTSSHTGKKSTSVICFVFEKQLALFQLQDLDALVQVASFKNHFDHLTGKYCDMKVEYEHFFDVWGTHIVTQQGVGGAIYITFQIQNSELDDEKLGEIEARLKIIFSDISVGGNVKSSLKKLRTLGVKNEQIQITGGTIHPTVSTFADITPTLLQNWNASLTDAPANLTSNSKAVPYHHLVSSGEQLHNMREATREYIKQKGINLDDQPPTQAGIATQMSQEAILSSMQDSTTCFPQGTLVSVIPVGAPEGLNGLKPIETLQYGDVLLTFSNAKLKGKSTRYLSMLHANENCMFNYLVLSFNNGKHLVVSDEHIIFRVLKNKTTCGIPASEFQIGFMAGYYSVNDSGKNILNTVECTSISRKQCLGAYAPLSLSGTFLANGFFVSCYADVSSFRLAQFAMVPLKFWHKMKFRYPRMKKGSSQSKAEKFVPKFKNNATTTISSNVIHPYAEFLLNIRRVWENKHAILEKTGNKDLD